MDFLTQSDVIQWKNGEYTAIRENTVDDEYTYLFIDYLPPRKFSTYPKNLDDFAVGYCLGEGLIKDCSQIESIRVDGTNVFITTVHAHSPEDDLEKEGIIQKRKGNCQHACVCRLLEYQGVNSDNAGGIRSQLKTITPNTSDLTVSATQIIGDFRYLTDNAVIWKKTAGVHVALLKYKDKAIIREDVSRHVAVDKVIGAAAKEGYDFSRCRVIYSGRMPADMLIKVVRVGIPIIISNAAPASSGLDVARKGNITVVGFVRDCRFTVFSAPERVDLKS